MKAIRYHARRDIRLEDVAPPSEDLKPDQVLVEPLVCGICGTDLHEYVAGPIVTPVEPHVYSGATLPQILGHEFSARVLAVGADVTHVAPGDRVSIQPLISPRDDYYGRRGLYHLSEKMACVGLSWDWGGLGERAVLNGYNVFKVPDTITDVQAAMIEPAAVALYGVDRGGVEAGSSVLVSGIGPIGALTLLAVKAAGAATIFVSETNPNRRALAKELVPEAVVFDPTAGDDILATIRAATEDGVGVDVALECVGAEASLNLCAEAVRRRGTVVQVGLHTKRAAIDAMLWALKDITLEATWCYPTTIWPRVATMIASGRFPVERIVTATIRPEEVVDKGFEALLDPTGRNMKILVAMGSGA
ncbi:2,3-butanediol dehydrogenase [Aureimonas sp. Leaf324]|uniref:2,3-butanediol dehydrogenase n=1 Tax=Aureimonas sp. Leaf324 TaxID=1736336 RepID=UPI0007005E82|nr:2,3-butanediol dehydrogenase [Aureimonas sp. Leaf324]KQQ86203.1 zinc-binding dehydrogenase [Aureimonas sp. Leaf324]